MSVRLPLYDSRIYRDNKSHFSHVRFPGPQGREGIYEL